MTAVVALIAPALCSVPTEAPAKSRNCLRGGAQLVSVNGSAAKTVVVRRVIRPHWYDFRADLMACWRPSGRRVVIRREYRRGLDSGERNRVTIVGRRYVGVRTSHYCDPCGSWRGKLVEGGTWGRAAVWDARTGRRLHRSVGCHRYESSGVIVGGVEEVVFLRRGGMGDGSAGLRLPDGHGARRR